MIRLKDISVTGRNTAIALSGAGMFHEGEKIPYGYVVEVALKERDEDGVNIIMPVFLPYNKQKLHLLRETALKSFAFMVELTFSNLEIRKKSSGGFYATASDFEIIQ